MKMAYSADGVRTHVTADVKGLMAQQTTAADLNCTEASASAIKTAVETIDNCISGSEAQVDIVAALPAGTNLLGKVGIDQVTANANEVVVKSGTVTAVTAITNALPAGTNNIGDVDVLTLPALAAGTNNIGDVDVLTVPAPLSLTGGGVEAAALRVTLASDSTGVLSVDDNGGVLTVDGSVTANAGTNLNTSALALEAGGNLAAATTALQIMDDWDNAASDGASVSGDVAHDAADAGEPVKVGAKAETSPAGITLVADGDRTNLYADADGLLLVKPYTSGADILSERVSNTDGASTAFTTFGATASVYNYITTVIVHNAHATTSGYVDLRDGAAGAVIATIPAPANGGTAISFPVPLKQPTANTALAFDASAAITTIYITLIGFKSKV